MKTPLFLKIFLGLIAIVVLMTGLVLTFSFVIIRHHYIDTLGEQLRNYCTVLSDQAVTIIRMNDLDSLDRTVKMLGKQTNTRITIIAPDGAVLADSEKDPQTMENHGMRSEIKDALQGQEGRAIRYSRTVKQEMLYVAVPARSNKTVIAVIRSSIYLSSINALISQLMTRIIYISLGLIVISVIVALLFARSISHPIQDLIHASRRVAHGDFDVNILFKRNDELKELAVSFNHMVEQLKTLIKEQSREKEALNTIIASIREGILVLDAKGKVLLCNNSFLEIIEQDSVQGKFYWELIRRPDLNELVDSVREGQRASFTTEIEIEQRTFICSAAYLSTAHQTVLTFHDITEIMEAAAMKKDLVLNVSHELRTPLTAIKGFIETMESADPGQYKRYIEIIKRHTDRLINIVEDLQTLSKLESRERLQIEEIDIHQIVRNVITMFKPAARHQKIKLLLKSKDPKILLKGDAFKLEQLFINLVDNALKYTEEGSITITTEQDDTRVLCKVIDTGIGIPLDQISRIFERFYVVDLSRSRKIGGTGLGLSIVKHIVQAHHGEITVESELDSGTTFTIKLPKTL
ncbi:HAMP domain-containing protein [candidate division WOR-3 bacterium]|nr:HAMP domain-containing protein [candidate division WOR-3 bacterium]